ncbi:hypothetical protein GCM10010095_24310 [Streptomyces anthocyanicus]|nr:hypothetical protein B0E38_04359 [Streptomyces sp. 111WW2]BDD76163.1 hypothetical protein JCM4020_67830 [Streptomyces coelicolor]GGL38101.1 hypothetical protein GCM10010095_24310 [Streptomyces anthocyanicus]
MAGNRKTTERRGEKRVKLPKNERAHRPCPHCGQIQPGSNHTDAPHKPSGLMRRRAKRQQLSEQSAAVDVQEKPVEPEPTDAERSTDVNDRTAPAVLEPVDAKTLIQGVVERIPAALAAATVGDAVPATGLNVAVRKAVLDEFRTRTQFAGRLAEIDALLWAQPDHGGELVNGSLEDHLRQLRLRRVTEPEEEGQFVVTEGEGDRFEVLRPAYVDELTGKVLLSGHLRRVPAGDSFVGEEE